MSALPIPPQYNHVMPYLIVPDALGLMKFLQTVFSATEQSKHLTDDGKLMHGEVRIGESVLMISEASDQWAAQPAGLYIHHSNADEGYRTALNAGATSVMEPADQPYGRSCGVKDPHGNTWWITTAP